MSREQFEAWWEINYHNGNPPRFGWEAWRDGDGYKIDDDESELDGMWQAWQAATKQAEAKCAALAAENAAMKEWSPNPHSASMFMAIEKAEQLMDGGMPELAMVEAFEILKMKRTPATDSFLAEVRAQGVDMFAKEMHADISEADAHEFAAQLRQDANTAELVAAGIITKVGE